MKDNNKLIAEFMWLGFRNGDFFMPKTSRGYVGGDWLSPSELQYHTSWDWLIPVVQKIYQLELDNEGALLVRDAVAEANLNNTYQAVLEFIKKYNDER